MDKKQRVGRFIKGSSAGGESYNAYLPQPLPPKPALDMAQIYPLLDKANIALGRLDGMSALLPDSSLFLYMYIRKEAVLSSQIEGTQSSLSDLLQFENAETPGAPLDDVREVSCYVAAMDYGLKRVKELPLSLRLLKEIHAQLMHNARGGTKQPGEFRRSQNWIGGSRPGTARFVPPPPEYVMDCLGNLENFLHDENHLPVLVKAAIAHVQFETIHPFLDGNGRLGRLLITFILCVEGLLSQPLLYLSLYLKTYRSEYYGYLQSVRETGDWESWIKFFLQGVIETSEQATQTAKLILSLFAEDRKTIEESGKSTAAVLSVHYYLQKHPITKSKNIADALNLVRQTVLRSLDTLEKLGIVRETTGNKQNKQFVYTKYLALLNEGTEPLK